MRNFDHTEKLAPMRRNRRRPLFKGGANAAGRSRQFRVLVQWNPLQQALKLMQPRAHRASESW